MSYVLRVVVREAEPYIGLQDEVEVREAVHQEVVNTINDLGSEILDEGTDEEREELSEQLTEKAMADLWRRPRAGQSDTRHILPGRVANWYMNSRHPGVLLILAQEEE